MSTHAPTRESFTDIVFLIPLVIVGDAHYGNTLMGYLCVLWVLDRSEGSSYAREETQSSSHRILSFPEYSPSMVGSLLFLTHNDFNGLMHKP